MRGRRGCVVAVIAMALPCCRRPRCCVTTASPSCATSVAARKARPHWREAVLARCQTPPVTSFEAIVKATWSTVTASPAVCRRCWRDCTSLAPRSRVSTLGEPLAYSTRASPGGSCATRWTTRSSPPASQGTACPRRHPPMEVRASRCTCGPKMIAGSKCAMTRAARSGGTPTSSSLGKCWRGKSEVASKCASCRKEGAGPARVLPRGATVRGGWGLAWSAVLTSP